MALNPIVFTEKVVRSFLRYQLTAYSFADERLLQQMRRLLSLDETRRSPLLKGPFISLSRSFRQGAAVDSLIQEGVLHPHMRQRIPAEITHLYGHQEEAIRAICSGKTTLVSTGTGSGKTECFLYPIVSRCLEMKDGNQPAGIASVIVYPMNALAEDQLIRLRGLLAGTGIPFGMYVGKTPEKESEVVGIKLPPGSSHADYEARLQEVRLEKRSETVHPPEEVCSRERMRTPGQQPRILLTNVKQLELLLTRQQDVELFADARLDFLVFDEAHTFSGAQGAETACLIRRLRSFCGRGPQETVCVATSATMADETNPNAARDFAARFFGVPRAAIATVGEAYEPEVWSSSRRIPKAPAKDPAALLSACVSAVDDEAAGQPALRKAYQDLAGAELPLGETPAALHSALSANELVFQLTEILASPRALHELPADLKARIGRPVSEEEILAWLTFGAAARKEGRPLLRPVVHGFIRGISGAVVSFPNEDEGLKLWLAAEDEVQASGGEVQSHHFPITTCTKCGQHYFLAFLKDFEFFGKAPSGGQAGEAGSCWEPLAEALGGRRVVLTDRIVGESEDEEVLENDKVQRIFFCRRCGAAHPTESSRCGHCGQAGKMVVLLAIRQTEDNPGFLPSCLSCGATGRLVNSRYREPARPVRSTNVADVHVLAQDMVHNSERPRLLVFCDNRQDAAFQAGWMKDHARRFRLRALMAEGMRNGPVSIGDLTHYLDSLLNRDEALSRALVPEVWLVARREGTGGRHQQERRKFLRIQILRELTISARDPIGLEPWGRMKVEYEGLDPVLSWIQQEANRLGIPAEDLREGVASLLDYFRRSNILYDPEFEIYSKYWADGDVEISQGYLPPGIHPLGTKLCLGATERPDLAKRWLSDRGDTTPRQIAKKWGVPADTIAPFLKGLFTSLAESGFLKPVQLKGSKGRPLPNISGVFQLDADRIRLRSNHGFWRCKACRRRTIRSTPHHLCPAWHCTGTIEFIREDPDNYDLQLLDQAYSMLRPEEHTAMVPSAERERLENYFKGESEAVNCFVCTPTLEMGVDIGKLDAILMRNVPPLPANYWQRAGRAGRRHRMAVNLTYCRPVSHDRAYFHDPLKLLAGRVDPPAFNLRNSLMVAKHVHATVFTRLHQYARDPHRSIDQRKWIETILKDALPSQAGHYLFKNGCIREEPFDFSPLAALVRDNLEDLVRYVQGAFSQGWPADDAEVVSSDLLRSYVEGTVLGLAEVIDRQRRRLRWAMLQIKRLNQMRDQRACLEPADEALFRRCDSLVKRLKGITRRARREAEGFEDGNTFGILAAEGFLPGYGLEIGAIQAAADIPFWHPGAKDFFLPRPPSTALREYVPGNLIYANGNRFVPRYFHRDVDEHRVEMPLFEVSVAREAVKVTQARADSSGLGPAVLPAISVCDVDLAHISHISDDEELRFQMPVMVFGSERGPHNGGTAFIWGGQPVHQRRAVALRLVNVGAVTAFQRTGNLGYPVCSVCGQSVSPLSSERQRAQFFDDHKERCGTRVEPLAFYSDIVADALSLPALSDRAMAYSVLETLRTAATQVLDMDTDDLQPLVVGQIDRDEVDALLWDPMPGGSGLLDQMLTRFDEIVAAARDFVNHCPSACATACVDCLQTFRNSQYHKFLNRHLALESLTRWGSQLRRSHEIPAQQITQASKPGADPVNNSERRLRQLLLGAGFGEGIRGEQIRLDRSLGTTTPDVIFRAEHHEDNEGVCIYLDGLSGQLHGNPETAAQDRLIRTWLRNNGYEVIEITATELHDQQAMTGHFRRLAGYLRNDQLKRTLLADSSWFGQALTLLPDFPPLLESVEPRVEDKYVKYLPLIPLQTAASGLADKKTISSAPCHWVEVPTGRRFGPGYFVAQVFGRSMEPSIPDGSFCIFAAPFTGSRQGRTVLVRLPEGQDPETGEPFTVKRYHSEKLKSAAGGWPLWRITLWPINRGFSPLIFEKDDEGELPVLAEFVEVLG